MRRYYTPGALLQERGESVKLLDLGRADAPQKREILKHLLVRGQILVSRSGTIGRVAMVMGSHAGHIGSDDLIRVEVDDDTLRYYVYGYLKTRLGQDQMSRNEYGTIQQHLEPRHVRDVVIPIPDDRDALKPIAAALRESVESRERSAELEEGALRTLSTLDSLSLTTTGANGGATGDRTT